LKLLVIDNYDSFTYNLVQIFGELDVDLVVKRNDEISIAEIKKLNPDRICISPGPGRPENAGISSTVIRGLGSTTPILGVCLGHQCIAQVFGGEVVCAEKLMHGKTSMIRHNRRGVFENLAQPRSDALSFAHCSPRVFTRFTRNHSRDRRARDHGFATSTAANPRRTISS
jgi:anthranilate synthase/aminodeoxychorismate synthase-like glutamine amidotransferase